MQELEDTLWGRDHFLNTVAKLTMYQREKHERKVKTTLSLLRLLPFRSILSTNFTRFFPGIDYVLRADEDTSVTQCRRVKSFECVTPQLADAPAATAYLRDFLESKAQSGGSLFARTLSQQLFRDAKLFLCANDDSQDAEKRMPALINGLDPPVLHIHGTTRPVCTRKGYRLLQTENSSYMEFMRCVFASSRILFYGYSRSDSYINDLRDQVMTILESGHRPREDTHAPVLGYHIEDVKDSSDDDVLQMMLYSRKHEGICVLPLRSTASSVVSEWTSFLRKLVQSASSQQMFAMSLASKRILCIERPYIQASCRSGFEESAYSLFMITHAAMSPSGCSADPMFDADALDFKRRRDDYSAMVSALGRPSARPLQKLHLPGKGKIVVTFSMDDLLSKCGDGSKWDLLMVAWDFELEFGVLQKLRSTANCFIPSLAYVQSRAPAPHPSTEQARSARHQARSRGFWDFCDSEERLYECIQTCFAQA
jgi:hypothetical protein